MMTRADFFNELAEELKAQWLEARKIRQESEWLLGEPGDPYIEENWRKYKELDKREMDLFHKYIDMCDKRHEAYQRESA